MLVTATALRTKDNKNRVVIFHQKNYDKHKRYHPELEDDTFFPQKVKNALKNPNFTVPGYRNDTTCYYFEEFALNGIIKYTKVVVMNKAYTVNGERAHAIMTAHKTDRVQEARYPELKITRY